MKKIGLIDVDSYIKCRFPNLALMKLSAWHKKQGDNVEFVNYFDEYDTIYKSKIFTYTPDDIFHVKTNEVIKGGTGYKLYNVNLPEEIEHICPDYDLYKVEDAYGFLTRGCPNKCSFCVVPKKEGALRKNADIEEFLAGRKKAILLDNNVLASDWGLAQIEKIIKLKIKIDFNQGLDARVIAGDEEIAKLLAHVKWEPYLRMACDHKSQIEPITKATELLRKHGCTPSNYFVYALVKDVDEANERVEYLRTLNLLPFAQPLRSIDENNEISQRQRDFARWVNRKAIFASTDFANYDPSKG
jgi:hypothetical protein